MAARQAQTQPNVVLTNVVYGAIAAVVIAMTAWTLSSVKDLAVAFGKVDTNEQWLVGEVKSLGGDTKALHVAIEALNREVAAIPSSRPGLVRGQAR